MSGIKSRRLRPRFIEAASNATPELFVTSTTARGDGLWDRTLDVALQEGRAAYSVLDGEEEELEALDRAARLLFDSEVVNDWATFDDDERWRETARTGRAL
jgi:hypothetical protein